jgi:4-hydroxybenzoate polyprenyltransferase
MLISMPLHLARELAKDLDDREADRGARRTLPVVAGLPLARIAMLIALVASGVALVFGLAPLVRSPALLLAALLPAMIALALAAMRALRGLPGSPAFFKLAMVCAMAALLVARA